MPTRTRTPTPALLAAGLAAVLGAALAGCSGSDSSLQAAAGIQHSTGAPAAASDPAAAVLLFDDQGRALPAAAQRQPADSTARTRNGLYATPAQYEWQELVAAPTTVLIDVDELGSVEAALRLAAQMQARRSTEPSPTLQALAFFVRARHLPEGAAVVNAMADAGFDAVFLLLPPVR